MSTTIPDDEFVAAGADTDLRQFRRRPVVTEPLGYIASLDGLRALAVLAVVLYHAHFPWIPGGFLGVSTFFTLSGFLITSLLLREWTGNSAIDLRRFWNRRFRRLLPASWLTMGVILCFGAVGVWNSDQLRAVRGDLPYSLLEIVNWHFIAANRSYGAEFTAPSPFAHFWSLAVEQQFYVLLPLLAVGVLTFGRSRLSRRRLNRLIVTFVVLTIVSAVANGLFARTSIDRAYYGTDTRMAEMLIGSLLACVTLRRLRLPTGRARTGAMALGVVGLLVTVWLWHEATLRSAWMYPWGLLLTAMCTASIIYAAVQGGVLSKLLTIAPLLWIGRISYGIYLLHWPVFLWLTPGRVGWSVWPLFALRMAVTIAASALLFRLVENPIRHGTRIRKPYGWVAAAVAAALLLGGDLVVTRDLLPASNLSLASSSATTVTTIPPPPVRVLVVGDAMAGSIGTALTGTDGLEVTVANVPDCGLALGGWVRVADGSIERDVDRCRGAHDQWVAAATQSRPDVVMVMPALRDAADRRLSTTNPWGGPQDPANDDFIRTEYGSVVDSLAATGAEVVLVTAPHVRNAVAPVPRPIVPPSDVNGEKGKMLAAAEVAAISEGRPDAGFAENDDTRIDHLNTILGEVATSRGVRLFDLGAQMRTWSGGEFDPALRRPDGVGVAAAAGSSINQWLLPQLRDSAPRPAPAAPAPVVAADAPLPEAPPVTPRRVVAPGSQVDVLVVGDSVAHNLAFGLEKWIARGSSDTTVINDGQLGCPIARGGSYRFKGDIEYFADSCEWSTKFPALVSGHRPDLVVLASGIWEVVDRRLPGDDRFRHIGDPGVDRYVLREFLSAIDALGADGATVALVTQPHIRPGLDQGFQGLPESDPARIDRLNELLREAASLRPGVVQIVDLQGWLQSQPGGEDDVSMRPDGIHFTDEFAPTMGAWLGPELRRIVEDG